LEIDGAEPGVVAGEEVGLLVRLRGARHAVCQS
jgi:hypothetical protein